MKVTVYRHKLEFRVLALQTNPQIKPQRWACCCQLALVVARHGLNLHQYADDAQVYVSTVARDAEAAVARVSRRH